MAMDATADSFTFTLTPLDGAVAGPPGSTVGWGYTITDPSPDNWLASTNFDSGLFQNGTPDASLFAFPILQPLQTLTVTYDPVNGTGLFRFSWDPNAPVGFVNTGLFTLSGEFYDDDPLNGGQFLNFAEDQSATYSATVTSPAPVPEPSTLLLSATGLAALLLRRTRLRTAATL